MKKWLFSASKSVILLKNRYFLNFAEKNKRKRKRRKKGKERGMKKRARQGSFEKLLVNVDFNHPAVLVNRELITGPVRDQPLDHEFEFLFADLAVVVF